MAEQNRNTVIQQGLTIFGSIFNGRRVEIHGNVEGDLSAESVLIHQTGRLDGRLQAEIAEISGTVQGEAYVTRLLSIAKSGCVTGTIHYAQLELAPGGILDASVKNIPPELAGDFALAVEKGRMVAVTTRDITAIDPDDLPQDLTFTISNVRHGFVTLAGAPRKPVAQFTQADLQAGNVNFVHGGGDSGSASFDVIVTDAEGANSGAAKTVKIDVMSGS